MNSQSFDRQLAFGKVAEGKIARWLINRCGYTVMPVYEVEMNTGKGPQIFAPRRELIAPDIFAFRGTNIRWIEAKHKTVFTWHRITQRWVTGIDLRHYQDYLEVARLNQWEVHLLFLHQSPTPDERDLPYCPGPCPTGLFSGELIYLAANENHRHANWGKSGMVYWAHEILKPLASLGEMNGYAEKTEAG